MNGRLGPLHVLENYSMYAVASPTMKVWMEVLRKGLTADERGHLRYDPQKQIDMHRLIKKLKPDVSPSDVYNGTDLSVQSGILVTTEPKPVRYESGRRGHERFVGVNPKYTAKLISCFRALHDIARID
jgi:hypothetical protein